jgi:hypothetical protein
MSEVRSHLIRLPIYLGLLGAFVAALLPGYQEIALKILIFTPLSVGLVTAFVLIGQKRYFAGASYLLAVGVTLFIALWGGLPE